MRLSHTNIARIIKHIMLSEDYYHEIDSIADDEFLHFSREFFREALMEKIDTGRITMD